MTRAPSGAPLRSPALTWLGLAGWLAITFLAAAIGSRYMPGEWYARLEKPSFNPPSSVFGPVWTALYLMMGIAAWLVWKRDGFAVARTALALYLGQLAVNAAWSWLFFGRHAIGLALVDIIVLWLLIVATLIQFWRHSRTAGLLLVPYLLWVSFATALNYAFLRLNP